MHLNRYGVWGNKIKTVLRRLLRLPFVLKPFEKWVVLGLLAIITGSLILNNWQLGELRPAYGGTYSEGFVGEPRFINPILATTDIDQSLVKLVYSGLTKLDKTGNVLPDLAKSWESPDAGKSYIVHLRDNVFWHDGQKFSAKDVSYTVALIQDQAIKSLFYDAWKDVLVETPDDLTIKFTLKDMSSVFPWRLTVGVLPQHLGRGSLNSSFVGTGAFKYSKVRMNKDRVEAIILTRNNKWYNSTPYINEAEFWFFANDTDAESAFKNQKIQTISDFGKGTDASTEYCLQLSQQLTLFINSQSTIFSDAKIRQKLLNTDEVFVPGITIKLVLDQDSHSDVNYEKIEGMWLKRGVTISEQLSSIESIKKDILPKHTYDILVLPIEYGPQVDPFSYWHSSQDASGLNFSRMKNNDLDKLIVTQRKTTDLSARAEVIKQINQLIDAQNVRKVLDENLSCYYVGKSVHVIRSEFGQNSADKFDTFNEWYIKTRR